MNEWGGGHIEPNQGVILQVLEIKTRLPGSVPQLIGLFLFCIEFGWG